MICYDIFVFGLCVHFVVVSTYVLMFHYVEVIYIYNGISQDNQQS